MSQKCSSTVDTTDTRVLLYICIHVLTYTISSHLGFLILNVMPASHGRWQTPRLHVISTCFYTLRISCFSTSYSSVVTKRKLQLWFHKLGDCYSSGTAGVGNQKWEQTLVEWDCSPRGGGGSRVLMAHPEEQTNLSVHVTTDAREKTAPRAKSETWGGRQGTPWWDWNLKIRWGGSGGISGGRARKDERIYWVFWNNGECNDLNAKFST